MRDHERPNPFHGSHFIRAHPAKLFFGTPFPPFLTNVKVEAVKIASGRRDF